MRRMAGRRVPRRLHPDVDGFGTGMLKVQRQVKFVTVFEGCLQVDQRELLVAGVAQSGGGVGRQDN